MFLQSAYSGRLFDPQRLRKTAGLALKALERVEKHAGKVHVVVTGKSGIAMAFAMSMIADISAVVVRKPGETSHGSKFEGHDGSVLDKYVILDDFVDTGSTVKTIVKDIQDYCRLESELAPVCIGFIEYCRLDENVVYGTLDVETCTGKVLNCGNRYMFKDWLNNYESEAFTTTYLPSEEFEAEL